MTKKFRIWDVKNKSFKIPSSERIEGTMFVLSKEGVLFSSVDNENFVIQQFTGLKDKNGREICEGDIIHSVIQKISERGEFKDYEEVATFEVKFINGQFAGWVHSDYFKEHQLIYPININLTHWSIKKFEVIGNIFENPELLS